MLEETLLSKPAPAISSFLTFKDLRVTDVRVLFFSSQSI